MKNTLIILTLLYIFGCSVSEQNTKVDSSLEGTWTPISQEIAGNPLPQEVFKNQKLIIQDTTYTVIAESIDKGTLKFDDNKIDIYGIDGVNSGKHYKALFKLENGSLIICYDLTGVDYPKEFETKSRDGLFLSVFKK